MAPIQYPDGKRLRRYTPDFELVLATGEVVLVEIEPARRLASTDTLTRLKSVIDPLDLAIGLPFLRKDIAPLFGATYRIGNWNAGHASLTDRNVVVLLVTINKQGKAKDHRYLDHWIDNRTFHWQSEQ